MGDQPRSIEEQIWGKKHRLEHVEPDLLGDSVLPMPSPTDSLIVLCDKLHNIALAVEQGRSAAVATGYAAATQRQCDPVIIAKRLMLPMELEQYEAWQEGMKLPEFDFELDRSEVPGGTAATKRYIDRAEALKALYHHPGQAAPENAAWYWQNYEYAIPLVKAMDRVIKARRNLHSGIHELSEHEVAEIQVCGKVTAIVNRALNETMVGPKALRRQIQEDIDTLHAHGDAIKRKMPNYNPIGISTKTKRPI